jgi:hypothetical protein
MMLKWGTGQKPPDKKPPNNDEKFSFFFCVIVQLLWICKIFFVFSNMIQDFFVYRHQELK